MSRLVKAYKLASTCTVFAASYPHLVLAALTAVQVKDWPEVYYNKIVCVALWSFGCLFSLVHSWFGFFDITDYFYGRNDWTSVPRSWVSLELPLEGYSNISLIYCLLEPSGAPYRWDHPYYLKTPCLILEMSKILLPTTSSLPIISWSQTSILSYVI